MEEGVNNIRWAEMHTPEPVLPEPEPSHFEAETAIEKVKRYKLPGTDQIPEELFIMF
jgi:hypothetical protein